MSRVIELDDVEAVNELPIDSVLICRVGEVFQVKRVGTFLGPDTGRAWFALGYANRIWSAEEVASWGPLRVLWPPAPDDDPPSFVASNGVAIHVTRLADVGPELLVDGVPLTPLNVAALREYFSR